ncbi:MAG: hypothetical protein Q3990_08230, partial [Desulfovibrionaceae bacterium]|nr:hypothetical protein [Desulfovibrionaceae bacterium]
IAAIRLAKMPIINSRREYIIGIPSLRRFCLSLMSRAQCTQTSLNKQGIAAGKGPLTQAFFRILRLCSLQRMQQCLFSKQAKLKSPV